MFVDVCICSAGWFVRHKTDNLDHIYVQLQMRFLAVYSYVQQMLALRSMMLNVLGCHCQCEVPYTVLHSGQPILTHFLHLQLDVIQMRPEERMATKRDSTMPGLLGYSRFFTNQGTFTWAPCYVLQYDRWVEGMHMGVGPLNVAAALLC